MRMFNPMEITLCGALLAASCLGMGCGKGVDGDAQAVVAAPRAPDAPQATAVAPDDADPVTRLAYKSGLPTEKVAKILEIYEKGSAAKESGRDIYNIALAGSRETGVSTEEVGAVILEYRGLLQSGLLKTAVTPKAEPPRG